MCIRFFTLVACVISCLPSTASAWSNPAHMTIAKLAWVQLNQAQRDAVSQMLQQHPHWKEFFLERRKERPDGVPEAEWDFLVASTWPDWVRGFTKSETPEGKAIARYNHGKQHYIDKPFILPADAELFRDKKLGPDKENVVTALRTYARQLKSDDTSPRQKAVALSWLLHLVGDIHQPLHATSFYSKDYDRGDQGGNLWWVKDRDRLTRLHAYWDGLLGDELDYGKAYPLVKRNTELLTRPEYRRDRFAKELKQADFDKWADESLSVAKKVAYRDGKLPGLKIARDQETEQMKAKAPALPDDYGQEARAAAQRRVALAGHRLLDLLVAVFPKKLP
jgi:hypothetical protein